MNPLLLKTRLKMLKTPCPTRLSDFHNYNIPFFLCKRQLPIFPKSIINEKTDEWEEFSRQVTAWEVEKYLDRV